MSTATVCEPCRRITGPATACVKACQGRHFITEQAGDDETWLCMYEDGEQIAQLDYCDGDPLTGDTDVLHVWQITVVEEHRARGLTRPLLDELRRRHPAATWLTLDLGTPAAHAVAQSWLGLPKGTSHQQARYPLPTVGTPAL